MFIFNFTRKTIKYYNNMVKVYPHIFRYLYSRFLLGIGVFYVKFKKLMEHSLNYMSFVPNELLKKVNKIKLKKRA